MKSGSKPRDEDAIQIQNQEREERQEREASANRYGSTNSSGTDPADMAAKLAANRQLVLNAADRLDSSPARPTAPASRTVVRPCLRW
jgi:hypothetical protein